MHDDNSKRRGGAARRRSPRRERAVYRRPDRRSTSALAETCMPRRLEVCLCLFGGWRLMAQNCCGVHSFGSTTVQGSGESAYATTAITIAAVSANVAEAASICRSACSMPSPHPAPQKSAQTTKFLNIEGNRPFFCM